MNDDQPRWTVDDGNLRCDGHLVSVINLRPDGHDHSATWPQRMALVADVRTARRAETEDWETKARQWDELQAAKAALSEWAGGDDA